MPLANSARLIFFDLETAGPNPKRHELIQIAAIAVDGECEPVEAFEARFVLTRIGPTNTPSEKIITHAVSGQLKHGRKPALHEILPIFSSDTPASP